MLEALTPSPPAVMVIDPPPTATESFPLRPSSAAVTAMVPLTIFRSSSEAMPSLQLAVTVSDPEPLMVRSSLPNRAASGSVVAASG